MTAQDAAVLADLLERNFETVADTYQDAYESGGGLEDLIVYLRARAAA